MGAISNIEWTDATVNFWWGCTKVGPGCENCYAETQANRFGENLWGIGAQRRKIKGAAALILRLQNSCAQFYRDLDRRRRVFVQSMSDLFDLEVPVEWFAEAWERILQCDGLEIQIVTKRVSAVRKRLAEIGVTKWPSHVGLMITVVTQQEANRDVPRLLQLKSELGIPWVGLSIEPMMGAIDLEKCWPNNNECWDALTGEIWRAGAGSIDSQTWSGGARLDWVIVGGESGPGARPIHPDWARAIRDQCSAAKVPFFFKQWGNWLPVLDRDNDDPDWRADYTRLRENGEAIINLAGGMGFHGERVHVVKSVGKKAAGRLLDGIEHNGMLERAAA